MTAEDFDPDDCPTPDELSLAETPALVAELGKRFENLVFISQMDINVQGDSEMHLYLSGNFYACLGLVADALDDLTSRKRENDES